MSKAMDIFTKLQQIINEELNNNNLLTISQKNRNILSTLLKDISCEELFNYYEEHEFAQLIANMRSAMPLEILWNFQKLNIFYLGSYIYFNTEESKKLPQLIVDLICLNLTKEHTERNHEEYDVVKQMYTDFLIEILISCEGPQIGNVSSNFQSEWTKTSLVIWQSVRRRLLSMLLNDMGEFKINYLKDVREKNILTETIVNKIYLDHLQQIVKHKPYVKVQMAIQHQSSWIKLKLDDYILEFFTEILSNIKNPLEEVIGIMQENEISWKWCLIAISICLHIYPCSTKFKSIVDDFLNKAFEKNDSDLLLIAFLLSRQASYENIPEYDNYSSWYSKKFGINAIGPTKNNKSSFNFLISFLTNIIPYETADILKLHLEKSFAAPPGCMVLIKEYKTLIRTRLADLDVESFQ